MHYGEEVPSNCKNLEETLTIQWNFVIQLDPYQILEQNYRINLEIYSITKIKKFKKIN